MNIASLGGEVRVVGAIGIDEAGQHLKRIFRDRGIDERRVFSFEAKKTITKTRVISNNQQLIRIDEESIESPSDRIIEVLKSSISEIVDKIDAIILSDYKKGFLSERVCQIFITEARERRIPIIVDPKGADANKYAGATILTPNIKEFFELCGAPRSDDRDIIREKALCLCKDYQLSYLVLTRSEKGISVIDAESETMDDFPTDAKDVIDVTGAGDTVAAVIALGYSGGFTVEECAVLANRAASIVISKFGAAQTTIDEIIGAFYHYDNNTELDSDALASYVALLKSQDKKIVFTNGCFDIIHAGHIKSFEQARKFGDVLIVGINSDSSTQRIKGGNRPIIGLENRIKLLKAIRHIDYVVSFEEDTPEELIEKLSPDVLVKGADWKGKSIAGGKYVTDNGGKIEFIEFEDGLSTTNIINKILC
jgi:D-beta-D-heptose 7-phosphate kinase/D-beta-D-heptose 1-phosphate adenosyltransferase